MAKCIQVHGRPLNWEKCAFDSAGLPIPKEPMDAEPRKWVERGGTVTTREWLYDCPAVMPNFAPKSSTPQGPATSSQAASGSGGGVVVATPVVSSLLGGDLRSPPVPTEPVSKRPRGALNEGAIPPTLKAPAKFARLRLKAPAPSSPGGIEAGA